MKVKISSLLITGMATLFLLSIALNGSAGDSTFLKTPGKVYGKIFSNFHTQIGNSNNATAFEIKRAYFGYEKKLSKHFEANVKLDIGSPEDLSPYSLIRRYAYFKNAYLKYSNKRLTTYFGIIDILHFKMQEKYWAHRYIEKSFADKYRFGVTADLAWQVIYDWADWISTDFTLMNGEGYTKLQADNTLKAGAGVSIFPLKNFVTRIYYDLSAKSIIESTLTAFIGYKIENKVIGGIEYNYKFNEDYKENHNRFGYSAYLSYYVLKKLQIFGRFDKVLSNKLGNEDNLWNLARDGSKIIAGIEYSPIKNVKVALDYQDWFPYAENEPNSQFIYLDVKVSF